MDTPATKNDINAVLEAVNSSASDMQNQFDEIKKDMATMATKEDLRASEQKVMDYVDRRVTGLEEKLVEPIGKTDDKINLVVETLEAHDVGTTEELTQIRKIDVFQAPPAVS